MSQAARLAQATIQYPREGNSLPTTFWAVGFAAVVDEPLVVQLTHDTTGAKVDGVVKRGAPRWVACFRVDEAGTYTMALYSKRADGKPLAIVRNLSFDMSRSVSTGFPNPSDQCCADYFFAYGTFTSPDTALSSATMTPSGGSAVGSSGVLYDANSWYAEWPQLSNSPPVYTLSISGNNGGSDQIGNLDVRSAYC